VLLSEFIVDCQDDTDVKSSSLAKPQLTTSVRQPPPLPAKQHRDKDRTALGSSKSQGRSAEDSCKSDEGTEQLSSKPQHSTLHQFNVVWSASWDALQYEPGGPWSTQNFGWMGHNIAFGPTNNWPICSLVLAQWN